MKILFCLFGILMSSSAFAGKEYQLEVRVIDGYTNEIVPNCIVKVRTKGDDLLLSNEITEQGSIFEDVTRKNLFIDVENTGNKFYERTVTFFNKKRIDTVFLLYLYPNQQYENEMLAVEDSIYGPRDSTYFNWKISGEGAQSASFPGGEAQLFIFISNQIRYPREAIDTDAQGKVYLEFIVEKDGTVTHVSVARGIGYLLDDEAKRALRAMPIWEPATDGKGKYFRTLARLPIVFTLN